MNVWYDGVEGYFRLAWPRVWSKGWNIDYHLRLLAMVNSVTRPASCRSVLEIQVFHLVQSSSMKSWDFVVRSLLNLNKLFRLKSRKCYFNMLSWHELSCYQLSVLFYYRWAIWRVVLAWILVKFFISTRRRLYDFNRLLMMVSQNWKVGLTVLSNVKTLVKVFIEFVLQFFFGLGLDHKLYIQFFCCIKKCNYLKKSCRFYLPDWKV